MSPVPFFYQEGMPADFQDFALSAETSNHVSRVLRMKQGDALILTDGVGSAYHVAIAAPDRKRTIVTLQYRETHITPNNRNGIAISLLKNEGRFEWFLEKATELGLRNIFPLITRRTERKIFRKERLEKVMVSAMLQSQQFFLPKLTDPMTLEDIFELDEFGQKFVAHCADDDDKIDLRTSSEGEIPTLILIGPEGDFTEDEIAACLKKDFLPVSLGETRLRTETAGIVAAVHLVS